MSYMQWTEALELGINVIDEQHKRIVHYINELDQVSQTGSADNIWYAMDGLVDYTITHFLFEEELLDRAGYSYTKAHKRVHDIFRKRVLAFAERAEKGENVIPELLPMLKVWLSTHITGEDRDYVELVKRVAGSTKQEDVGWLATTLTRLFGAKPRAPGLRA